MYLSAFLFSFVFFFMFKNLFLYNYGDRKFCSLAKLDQSITLASIKKFVDDEEAKYD